METNKIKVDKYRFFLPHQFKEMYQYLNKNGRHTADLMIHTGGRIMEVRAFVESPVFDGERKTITFLRTKIRAKLKERVPRSRTLPLNLKYYFQLRKDLESGKFRVLSTNAFNIQLRDACVKAKIKSPEQFSSHNIRKTFATWLLSMGVNSDRLAKHLGHTVQELFEDYTSNAYFIEKDIRIIMEVLGDIPGRINVKPL